MHHTLNEQLNIKLTPLPYQKRRSSTFRWTLLLYSFITVIFIFSAHSDTLLVAIPGVIGLFILDYSRRLQWIRYVIDHLESDPSGITLSYYEKDDLLSVVITWNELKISKGTTFAKNPAKLITVRKGPYKVASFYGDRDAGIDNDKMEELYRQLKVLKEANINNPAR